MTRPDRPGIDVDVEPPAVRMNDALGGILTFKLKVRDMPSAGLPGLLIGSPLNFVNCLTGSPIDPRRRSAQAADPTSNFTCPGQGCAQWKDSPYLAGPRLSFQGPFRAQIDDRLSNRWPTLSLPIGIHEEKRGVAHVSVAC